jgi:polyhydroxyalkanoate synthesis regulator protein
MIRRYGGSRLYDTVERRYVAMAELRHWRAAQVGFMVVDAATGEDITASLFA